jgi:hypothetical protein
MFEVLIRGCQVFSKKELDITKGEQKPSRRGGPGAAKRVDERESVTQAGAELASTFAPKRKADEVEGEETPKTYVSKYAPGARGHTSFLLFAKFHCRD